VIRANIKTNYEVSKLGNNMQQFHIWCSNGRKEKFINVLVISSINFLALNPKYFKVENLRMEHEYKNI